MLTVSRLTHTGETVTLEQALIRSCNIPFAMLAVELGEDRIRAQAELMGFGRDIEIPMSVTPSIYPENMSLAEVGLTGFGQFDVRGVVGVGTIDDGVLAGVGDESMADRVWTTTKSRFFESRVSASHVLRMTSVSPARNGTSPIWVGA